MVWRGKGGGGRDWGWRLERESLVGDGGRWCGGLGWSRVGGGVVGGRWSFGGWRGGEGGWVGGVRSGVGGGVGGGFGGWEVGGGGVGGGGAGGGG